MSDGIATLSRRDSDRLLSLVLGVAHAVRSVLPGVSVKVEPEGFGEDGFDAVFSLHDAAASAGRGGRDYTAVLFVYEDRDDPRDQRDAWGPSFVTAVSQAVDAAVSVSPWVCAVVDELGVACARDGLPNVAARLRADAEHMRARLPRAA